MSTPLPLASTIVSLLEALPQGVSVGYGPVCAKNYGLPWGVK